MTTEQSTTTGSGASSQDQYLVRGRSLPWLLLPSRLLLFAAFQAVIALVLWIATARFDLQAAGLYWPFAATGANIVTVLVLWLVYKNEGRSFVELYKFTKGSVGKDILVVVALFVLAAPLSMFPNTLLGNALFGNVSAVMPLLFGSLPRLVAYLTLVFPLTIAFAELPLYMGYILPRISEQSGSRVLAVLVAGFFLALQHCTLPLVFDLRFVLWRFGMFLPLALFLAVVLAWRPRLLPYVMIGHALLDLTTVVMLISASSG